MSTVSDCSDYNNSIIKQVGDHTNDDMVFEDISPDLKSDLNHLSNEDNEK